MKAAIYAVYFTAAGGNSMGVFILTDDLLSGADIGGMIYDGALKLDEKTNELTGNIKYIVPPDMALITGMKAGNTPIELATQIRIPREPEKAPFVSIQTPTGPVNAKFVKIRELD